MAVNGKLRVAIVGCGLIGQKRAKSLGRDARLILCCDTNSQKAEALARQYAGAAVSDDWKSAVGSGDVDAVFVCTTHNMLAPVAEMAARSGKHVLIEKPGACKASELDRVGDAAKSAGVLVRLGFNHRYHRSFQKAREIYDSGVLGELMFIRARYGHGGRIGYDQEWRGIPEVSGGGEAIDQGIHLIDLARWFLGDLQFIAGRAPVYFWNMPVEDNAFFLLESPTRQVAFLHASWTEWKNLFSFEISGRMGKLEIAGLGGSYGTERLMHYQMLPEMGPPPTTIYEYPMADNSWEMEIADFILDIKSGRAPQPGLSDGQSALRIVEQLYSGTKA